MGGSFQNFFFHPNFFFIQFFFFTSKKFSHSLFYAFLDVFCQPECSKKFSPKMFFYPKLFSVKQGMTQCYQAFLVFDRSNLLCHLKNVNFLPFVLSALTKVDDVTQKRSVSRISWLYNPFPATHKPGGPCASDVAGPNSTKVS